MENIDTKHFKEKLEEEFKLLEEELGKIGKRNPSNPADWEPKSAGFDIQEADRNEAADRVQAFERNTAVLNDLEIRYNNVKLALKKIEEGNYGVCEKTEDKIPVERLEANPAARTCMEHIENES